MKILFATHDLSYADHIAFAYLSAVARERGHQTYFCTLDPEKFSPNGLLAMVRVRKPDIIAYSSNLVGFKRAVELNKEVPFINYATTIMGGPQVTYFPETFAESGMHYYCMGEGELAFAEFLHEYEQGRVPAKVANIISAQGVNPVRRLVENLDSLPMPDRDLVLSNSLLGQVSKKTFYATRGCPFSCTYCANNYYHKLYKGKGPYVRRFGVERLMAEIRHVKEKYRMEFLKFGDDVFVMYANEWLEEFAKRYKREINVPFNCYLRIDAINADVMKLLKEAGCYSVHLSVDSTSKDIRERVLGRQMRTDDITRALKIVNAYGINTWVNFMLAAPESTFDDDLAAIKMSRDGDVTYASFCTTVPMKGTELHRFSVEKGYIPADFDDPMTIDEPSKLGGFTERDKEMRYNIYLLGPIAAHVPEWLYRILVWLIKNTRPNRLYRKIRDLYYKWSIERKIFMVGE